VTNHNAADAATIEKMPAFRRQTSKFISTSLYKFCDGKQSVVELVRMGTEYKGVDRLAAERRRHWFGRGRGAES
jgi:hypothetical protein